MHTDVAAMYAPAFMLPEVDLRDPMSGRLLQVSTIAKAYLKQSNSIAKKYDISNMKARN